MPESAPISPSALADIVLPFGHSRTLPADAYRSHELFAWEQHHIFSTGWTCLGRAADLLRPGQMRAVGVAGEEVLLVRDVAGTLTAFSNVCRHRGHPLVEVGEAIDVRQIRCPYHSWAYRLDGSLRTAPTFRPEDGFDASEWSLSPIRAGQWMGWLFVDLSGQAGPLDDTFGNAAALLEPYEPEHLLPAQVHAYDVAANWKLVVENYHECYHCTSIHPALCELTPPDSGADIAPDGLWCGGTMRLKDHAVTMSMTGESGGTTFRRLESGFERTVLYIGLWPNLLVSAHPDYVMTHRLVPLAPDRTRVECVWYFAPESLELDGFDPSYAVDFWDLTNREDWTACERIQRATASRGFRPGPLSPWESTIYQFLSMLAAAYRGETCSAPMVPEARLLT